MKGPFGLLLIGGGIILIVGLFTGKITFASGGVGDVTSVPYPGAQAAKNQAQPTKNVPNGIIPAGRK